MRQLGLVEDNEILQLRGMVYMLDPNGEQWEFELTPLGKFDPIIRNKVVVGKFRSADHLLEAVRAFMRQKLEPLANPGVNEQQV